MLYTSEVANTETISPAWSCSYTVHGPVCPPTLHCLFSASLSSSDPFSQRIIWKWKFQVYKMRKKTYFAGKRNVFAVFKIFLTFSITRLESQSDFLWWTPLIRNQGNYCPWLFILSIYHSPMWKTLGPLTIITWSFSFMKLRETCCKDQSQL